VHNRLEKEKPCLTEIGQNKKRCIDRRTV